MFSIAGKWIFPADEAAENRKCCIHNGDGNNQKGGNETNQIIRLSSKENGHTGKHEAEEKASSIAHEN